jgi:hypothetical protein
MKNLKHFIERWRFEVVVLGLFFMGFVGYVLFVRVGKSTTTVYVKASMERADWWNNHSNMPTSLLDNMPIPAKDPSGKVTLLDLKYFSADAPDWETEKFNSVGKALLKIEAEKTYGNLAFESQELLIGNPLVVTLNNNRIEFLITDIADQPLEDVYEEVDIRVKVYDLEPEYYEYFKQGMMLSDNQNRPYGEIVDVLLQPGVWVAVDQWGNTLLRAHPRNKDAIVRLRVKARSVHNEWIGYDERPIVIRNKFMLNNPMLKKFDAFVIDIVENE